jgi:hypothetical protein
VARDRQPEGKSKGPPLTKAVSKPKTQDPEKTEFLGDFLTLSREEKDLLASALFEFVGHRGPSAEEYVKRRYGGPGYSDKFKKDKVHSVRQRLALAEGLRKRVIDLLAN